MTSRSTLSGDPASKDFSRHERPPDHPHRDVLGAVLAGGKSSRMGIDKAMLRTADGKTYLDHAISTLKALVPLVIVAGRDYEREPTLGLQDVVSCAGPAAGVLTALQFARSQGLASVLVIPVDMPDLHSEHVRRLLVLRQAGDPTCATFAGGRLEPLIAIYPTDALDELRDWVVSTRCGLSAWVASRRHHLVKLPPSAARNVNTPADLDGGIGSSELDP